MSLLTKRCVIGAKTETTELSAAALAATDYLLAEEVSWKPVAEKNERPAVRASLDTLSHVTGKRHVELTFRSEIKASGAAGTPYAPISALLQACAFAETIVGGASVTYAPTSAPASASFAGPGKTCTIEIYRGGYTSSLKQVVTGCRGNVRLVMTAGGVCYYEFTMKGIYAAVTDAAFPSTTYLSANPPALVSATFLLQAYAAVISKMEIDCGNEVVMRDDVNAATGVGGFLVTGRKPVGSCDPEAPLVAGHDFFGKFISGAEASSSILISGGAGNITTITLPKTQYRELTPGERNGIMTFEMGLQFNQNAGDDWISIAQT
jgi:hypothetical protein